MKLLDLLKSTINALKIYFASKDDLKQKQDVITDEEMIIKMAECNIIHPIASPSSKLYTNNDGKIYIF